MSSPSLTPLSDFLGPQRRADMLRQATFFGAATAVLGVALLIGLVSWLAAELGGNGMSLVEWLLALPGSVLLAGLICLVPWLVRRNLRRRATGRLALAGTRLVVEDSYDRQEVDLATALCRVKLAGGNRSNRWPVLEVRRDEEDLMPVVVDLADLDTRVMRSPEDLLALAAALDRSDRKESWDAAGRLRTLATWKSLPMIYGADPDAIPITPAGAETARPTPVRSGEPSPEISLPARPPVPPARRAAVDVLLVLVAVAVVLASLTVASATQATAAFGDVSRTGVARATSCQRHGPVSGSGFGYWYDCTAEVTWSGGERSTVSTGQSVLTSADIGHDVQVRELTGTRRNGTKIVRADDPPRRWGAFVFFPLFLIGLGFLLRPAVDLFRLGRRLRARPQ